MTTDEHPDKTSSWTFSTKAYRPQAPPREVATFVDGFIIGALVMLNVWIAWANLAKFTAP